MKLLEIAKTGVERATLAVSAKQRETDEATATAWINQQLEALGIKPQPRFVMSQRDDRVYVGHYSMFGN
jgi:hypothetical protein